MRKFLAVTVLLKAAQASDCTEGFDCDEVSDEVAMLQLRAAPAVEQVRDRSLGSAPFLGGRDLGAEESGRIKINVDGVIEECWLPGAKTIDNFTTVEYHPPYRFYLMKEYTTDYSKAENFYMPPLVGKTFSVDVNYGPDGAGCGCNLNFYLVDMPASSAGKDGDWYCDAQCFPDLGCCYEFDMNEGNAEVQQITNHACTGYYPGHPDWECHKWGEPEDKTQAFEFSPGPGHTIDSNKPFTYEQEFREENGQAIVITRMIQGSVKLEKTMGPGSSELNAMFNVIREGMVFVTGYWFDSSMNWLDGEECGNGPEHCSKKPAWIGNWRITTTSDSPAPVPRPAPGPRPAPAPAPEPAPAPAAHKGQCHWESCENTVISGWCNESKDHCRGCGGGVWCPVRAGKCCWQQCGPQAIEGWCSKSADNCAGCGGGVWCP